MQIAEAPAQSGDRFCYLLLLLCLLLNFASVIPGVNEPADRQDRCHRIQCSPSHEVAKTIEGDGGEDADECSDESAFTKQAPNQSVDGRDGGEQADDERRCDQWADVAGCHGENAPEDAVENGGDKLPYVGGTTFKRATHIDAQASNHDGQRNNDAKDGLSGVPE